MHHRLTWGAPEAPLHEGEPEGPPQAGETDQEEPSHLQGTPGDRELFGEIVEEALQSARLVTRPECGGQADEEREEQQRYRTVDEERKDAPNQGGRLELAAGCERLGGIARGTVVG